MTIDTPTITLFVTGNDPDLFSWLIEDTLAEKGERGDRAFFTLGDDTLELIFGEKIPEGVLESELDGCLCLMRFVDQQELQKVSCILSEFSDRHPLLIHFLIYRKMSEQDFKMSCPFCGQKLWVRDADLDKRGRCPNCKKGFTLPKQEDQVINLLGLKQTAPIHRVMHEDASSVMAAIRVFVKRKEERDALMASKHVFRENTKTMNVSVD